MKIVNLENVLTKHKLRITNCRLDVLNLFVTEERALSQKDLEDRLINYDRVTLYRTLSTFIDSGIIHKIPTDAGIVSYGICFDTCEPGCHFHDHVHFKCSECNLLECIYETVEIPMINLPENYVMNNMDIIISGLCARCSNSN